MPPAQDTVFLEEARERRFGDVVCQKRKCVIDEIDELKAKRLRLEGDVTELTKCADEFVISAETESRLQLCD